jgi:hypothetical protein
MTTIGGLKVVFQEIKRNLFDLFSAKKSKEHRRNLKKSIFSIKSPFY